MKNIFWVLTYFVLAVNLQSQPSIETFPLIDRHLKVERIPVFRTQSILNQRKIVIVDSDTILSIINQQIFYFPDRQFIFKYEDNGTLSYRVDMQLLNDTTVNYIFEQVDDESFYRYTSTKKYNNYGLLVECRTILSEFDIPGIEIIEKYEYTRDTLLSKKYRYLDDSLLQFDSLVYDNRGKLIEVHIYNHQDDHYALKKYNYTHLNSILDNIKTYLQDGNLYKKITFPEGSQYRPKGEILIQNYRDPEKNRFYAVETIKYVQTQYSDYTELLIEEYYDHILMKRYKRKYDLHGRIIEKINNQIPTKKIPKRKELYFYELDKSD